MRVPKIYLETTMFNFYFADDAPEKRDFTIKLFNEIASGKYLPYTSDYVISEISRAGEEKQKKLLGLIAGYKVQVLEVKR